MKRLVLLLVLVLFPAVLMAAPFLVCDAPEPGQDIATYSFTGQLGFTSVASEIDGSLRANVVDAPVGTYTIEVKACNLWGECSEPAPFDFVRPSVPNAPANIELVL
jgi:hypothetical protein